MEDIAAFLKTTPAAKHWETIGAKQHHGIDVPLFSLHSKNSAGIGEFPDLIPLLDWCSQIGLDVLQLLPLNDTGQDSSPYSLLSAFALNPIHLGLSVLPNVQNSPMLTTILKEAQSLTANQRIDYSKLRLVRDNFLKEYFMAQGQELKSTQDFANYISANPWLKGYALFKSIKEGCRAPSWICWPEEYRSPSPESLEVLVKKYEVEMDYFQLVQYLCFRQMQQVKEHAEKVGVYLMGDLPILINNESADVWEHPSLFNRNLSAGAPPDHYADEGQNWGFPLYNWDAMKAQGYAWWKERLAVAQNFYHLYRLDHVVGFYRIWAIAQGEKATQGRFIPEDKNSWINHGEQILIMMLSASTMLPIAEDLGTIPDEVRMNLKELGICGTKVMRWERNWEGDKRFTIPNDYPILSLTTVSTHDSSTLAQWWVQSRDESRSYASERGWEYALPLNSKQHFSILFDSHHTPSLFHVNLLNEYFALFPELVWPTYKEERINTPGIVSDANWTYRFRPSIEQFTTYVPLAFLISDLTVIAHTNKI